MDTEGSFECTCGPGYTGDGFNCSGECRERETWHVCRRLEALVMCCADIDECASGSNPCNVTVSECLNRPGSFECVCRPGFNETNGDCVCKCFQLVL